MDLKPYQAVFFDLSGVLYVGDRLVDGAVQTVSEARRRGLTLRFVTNTATKNHRQILEKLHAMAIPLEDDELFTAPMATLARVRKQKLRPYCLIHENLREDFAEVDQQNPDAVVLGDAREKLNYEHLNRAFQIVQQGGELIAIGYNRYFRDGEDLMLDAGAFVKALEWASGSKALVTGKPSADFFREVVASTPYPAEECLMIGDDAEADVAAAIAAGVGGCLVHTGKYEKGDEEKLPADALQLDSVASLFATAHG